MNVKLKSITPQIEQTIVEIARVSSSRVDKSEDISGLIGYLIRNKHWSPFEHGFMTLEIKTSKAIGIQLIRHRSFTFQEFSQRYAEVTDLEDVEFRHQANENRQSSTVTLGGIQFLPDGDSSAYFEEELADEYQDWINRVQTNLDTNLELYTEGIRLGIAKESARMILPMTTQTTIYMTGSIRSWIHLIMIRDDAHAQKEIQLIAGKMKEIFIQELPIISKSLEYI